MNVQVTLKTELFNRTPGPDRDWTMLRDRRKLLLGRINCEVPQIELRSVVVIAWCVGMAQLLQGYRGETGGSAHWLIETAPFGG